MKSALGRSHEANTADYRRLTSADAGIARAAFSTMAEVFEEPAEELDDSYLKRLLSTPAVWVVVALVDGIVVGAMTAHEIPMTRSASSELFIYDIAVAVSWQRRGIGAGLIGHLQNLAASGGIRSTFVAADTEDTHALDFYRALGGAESDVTMFDFPNQPDPDV